MCTCNSKGALVVAWAYHRLSLTSINLGDDTERLVPLNQRCFHDGSTTSNRSGGRHAGSVARATATHQVRGTIRDKYLTPSAQQSDSGPPNLGRKDYDNRSGASGPDTFWHRVRIDANQLL